MIPNYLFRDDWNSNSCLFGTSHTYHYTTSCFVEYLCKQLNKKFNFGLSFLNLDRVWLEFLVQVFKVWVKFLSLGRVFIIGSNFHIWIEFSSMFEFSSLRRVLDMIFHILVEFLIFGSSSHIWIEFFICKIEFFLGQFWSKICVWIKFKIKFWIEFLSQLILT